MVVPYHSGDKPAIVKRLLRIGRQLADGEALGDADVAMRALHDTLRVAPKLEVNPNLFHEKRGRINSERATIAKKPLNEHGIFCIEFEPLSERCERLIPTLTVASTRAVELDHLILRDAKLLQACPLFAKFLEDSVRIDSSVGHTSRIG